MHKLNSQRCTLHPHMSHRECLFVFSDTSSFPEHTHGLVSLPTWASPCVHLQMLQASGRAAVGHGEGATVQQAIKAAVHAPGLGSLHMVSQWITSSGLATS
jgi:hypothetical protein